MNLTKARVGSATVLAVASLGTAHTAAASGRPQSSVTIPFEMVKNQIVLSVARAGGAAANFLLDTGVVPSAIDVTLAREAGVLVSEEPVGYVGGVGSDDGIALYDAALDGFSLAGISLDGTAAVATERGMGGLSSSLGAPLGGILGHSFFSGRVVTIDYPARQVTIGEPPAAALGTLLYDAPLVFVDDDIIPLLTDVIVDGVSVALSLDTGSSLTLELYPDGARRAGIEPEAGSETTVRGARGTEEVLRGRAGEVRLGGAAVHDAEVVLPPHQRPGNREGNLGNGFLSGYVLVLDYVDMRMRLHEPVSR